MHVNYKRDVSHNYLIIEEEEKIDISSYQVRMLAGNIIPSVLRCRLQNLDGRIYFYYEITSRQSVSSYFEKRKMREEDLYMIFGGFIRVMEELSEHLLNPEQLLLNPDYIYLDVETGTAFFCCIPGTGREVQQQLRDLMEYILPRLEHEDQNAVLVGYGIYRKILEPGFQMEMLKQAVCGAELKKEELSETETKQEEVISEKDGWEDEKSADTVGGEECSIGIDGGEWRWAAACIGALLTLAGLLAACVLGYIPWLPAEAVIGLGAAVFGILGFILWAAGKVRQHKEKNVSWKRNENCKEAGPEKNHGGKENSREIYSREEEVSYEEDRGFTDRKLNAEELHQDGLLGETVVLSERTFSGPPSLVSREPGELATIYLEQEFTVVGKLANAADAVIPVSTVSRVHARIRRKDEEYYLADLNSRNGTMVNGRMLKNDEECLLHDEDQVDFAQARYIFIR